MTVSMQNYIIIFYLPNILTILNCLVFHPPLFSRPRNFVSLDENDIIVFGIIVGNVDDAGQ